MKKIRVLIVDDSALIRKMLSAALALADDIEVVGTATDAFHARELIKLHNPDVLTLDVEMPRMDGLSFLANLMRLRPMPVVMVSTLTTKASKVALDALELGAVDYIAKPSADLRGDIKEFALEVQEKIRIAASANVRCLQKPGSKLAGRKKYLLPGDVVSIGGAFKHLIVIGASTGGTEAIKAVLMGLPAGCPPILIALHIPANFSTSFAKRLDENCAMRVLEAQHDQPVTSGIAYLAPGDQHLTLRESDGKYFCRLDTQPKINRHRPAVDVLFDSIKAKVKNGKAIGVLLTGMGADGAAGLRRMRDAGFHTIVQDEATSVVWGMPGSAVKMQAVDKVLPLGSIAAELLVLKKKSRLDKARA